MKVSKLYVSSQPARASGKASAYGTYGLTSSTGVPSSTSSASTSSVRPSARSSRSADSPIGFGRSGERVDSTPTGRDGRSSAPRTPPPPGGGRTSRLQPGLRWKWKSSHTWLKPAKSRTLSSSPAFSRICACAGGEEPPGGGAVTEVWRDAWARAQVAVEDAAEGKEWFELEDTGVASRAYINAVRTCLSLGSKRNWLCAAARGAIVANFDDDDVYVPTYLERMVGGT